MIGLRANRCDINVLHVKLPRDGCNHTALLGRFSKRGREIKGVVTQHYKDQQRLTGMKRKEKDKEAKAGRIDTLNILLTMRTATSL